MVDMLDTAPSMRRLPFSFANRFKLVLETEHPERHLFFTMSSRLTLRLWLKSVVY